MLPEAAGFLSNALQLDGSCGRSLLLLSLGLLFLLFFLLLLRVQRFVAHADVDTCSARREGRGV